MSASPSRSKIKAPAEIRRLEDLPNIGQKLAADLRLAGVMQPLDLLNREPLSLFRDLAPIMGPRHDPCVFYTLLAVRHFLQHSEAFSWWKFTAQGKEILKR